MFLSMNLSEKHFICLLSHTQIHVLQCVFEKLKVFGSTQRHVMCPHRVWRISLKQLTTAPSDDNYTESYNNKNPVNSCHP